MPPRRLQKFPRPTPNDRAFEVRVLNAQVQDDWDVLLRTRNGPATRCWDHVSQTPRAPVGSTYTRWRGTMRDVIVDRAVLEQWQWEPDRGARIKVGVGDGYVVVVSVSLGHPRENEK